MKKLEAKTLDIIVPTNLALNRFETYLNDCPLPVSFNKDINADAITLTIDIKTGKVINWLPEYDEYVFFVKVVDAGTYILRDEDGEILDCLCTDYVPNNLIPEHDCYGDYIDMTISRKGYVVNWYNTPQLSDFHVDFEEIKRIFEE